MNQTDFFSGFYKHSVSKRIELIESWLKLKISSTDKELQESIGNQMIENYLFNYHLPLGVTVNLSVNDKPYVVPMAIEEPSVIAAASFGAKTLGNITAHTSERLLVGQIVMTISQPFTQVEEIIRQNKSFLLEQASKASQSMVNRGGGPRDIWVEKKDHESHNFISIYLSLDPCDAMGANVINTVLETIAPDILALIGGDVLMSILSNYQPDAVTTATAKVEIKSLNRDFEQAMRLAQRMELASDYAAIDPYRATTHNKGVMNGIDAVVIATGNDWRAVEAGAHAFASKYGQYSSLTRWNIDETGQFLIGEIKIPLQIATVGGTLSNHPTARASLAMMQVKDAKELSNIIAAVGLAQNFSAVRALVSDGIQKGHMRMQARALALQVGAKVEEIPHVVSELNESKQMNRSTATEILNKLRNNSK